MKAVERNESRCWCSCYRDCSCEVLCSGIAAGSAQARILLFEGQRLVDGEAEQEQIDHIKKEKMYLAGTNYLEIIRDFTRCVPIQRKGVGQAVDSQGQEDGKNIDDLS